MRARTWVESRTGGSAQEEALVTISASDGMIQVGVFQILEPREGTIDLRPFGRDELGGCGNGRVQRRVEEASQRKTLGATVYHCTMQHALVHGVAQNLEEITNVDDEAVGAGLHRDPFAINLHLEAGDAVLVKDR